MTELIRQAQEELDDLRQRLAEAERYKFHYAAYLRERVATCETRVRKLENHASRAPEQPHLF